MTSALYVKHQPRKFSDLIGAGDLQPLRAAVAAGEPHHAYLLTGPPGTGKTAVARLIAAGLNCDRGPTDTPCDECHSCQAIRGRSSMDVQEIDAGQAPSETLRRLKEQAATVSAFGRWRVFIIDHAQHVSKGAWAALLSPLGDPPDRTVFVICASDPGRLPRTIRSRCEHHPLHVGTVGQLTELVLTVAGRERAAVDRHAAQLIAEQARGSYRDALGLLGKALHCASGPLTAEHVRACLPHPPAGKLVAAVIAGDMRRVRAQLQTAGSDPLAALNSAFAHVGALLRQQPGPGEGTGSLRLLAFADDLQRALEAAAGGADVDAALTAACVRAAARRSPAADDSEICGRLDRLETLLLAAIRAAPPETADY